MKELVYHVCSYKRLDTYRKNGRINPPVRAWRTMESAVNFSMQTGRPVILPLIIKEVWEILDGHKGNAVISYNTKELRK